MAALSQQGDSSQELFGAFLYPGQNVVNRQRPIDYWWQAKTDYFYVFVLLSYSGCRATDSGKSLYRERGLGGE